MPEPPTQPTHAADPNQPRPRCRAITTDGHRCNKGATYNGHLCWSHARHRNPVCPDPSHVVVPLLEDHASVQLVLSQVVHGLLTHKLETDCARTIIYSCQIVTATLPRPPRLPSPKAGPDPNQSSAEGGSAPDGQSAAPDGQSAQRPEASAPWPDEQVYRLALDYAGIISGDGDLPAPSAHWQPASPEATPWDIIAMAPNQSKPTPRDPHDPDTHCSCPICGEIEKMKGSPWDHPHLQPVVNPYCKQNRSGCEGPGSPTQCSYCEGLYKYDPRKYDRPRRRHSDPAEKTRVPHVPGVGTWEADTADGSPSSRVPHVPGVGTWETDTADGSPSPRVPHVPGVGTWEADTASSVRSVAKSRVPHPSRPAVSGQSVEGNTVDDFDPGLCLPNPIPEQFPDDDPMLRGYIPLPDSAGSPAAEPDSAACEPGPGITLDLKACADRAVATGDGLQATGCRQGNTQKLLPSNPFTINKTIPSQPGGTPREAISHRRKARS